MQQVERRLLDKLVRELARTELHAIEHAPREARRLGEVPPVVALRAVAEHASAMQGRLFDLLHGHGIAPSPSAVASMLSTLRMIADRVHDAERAYRTALLDLRHGLDVTSLLRGVARTDGLFGIIRWCDDWLRARRTLVARVEAQLAWFAADAGVDIGILPAPVAAPCISDDAEAPPHSSAPGDRPNASDVP